MRGWYGRECIWEGMHNLKSKCFAGKTSLFVGTCFLQQAYSWAPAFFGAADAALSAGSGAAGSSFSGTSGLCNTLCCDAGTAAGGGVGWCDGATLHTGATRSVAAGTFFWRRLGLGPLLSYIQSSIRPFIRTSVDPSIHPSMHPSIQMLSSIHRSFRLSIRPSVYPTSVHPCTHV